MHLLLAMVQLLRLRLLHLLQRLLQHLLLHLHLPLSQKLQHLRLLQHPHQPPLLPLK